MGIIAKNLLQSWVQTIALEDLQVTYFLNPQEER